MKGDQLEALGERLATALEELGHITLRRANDPDEEATDEEREEARRLAALGFDVARRWRHGSDHA